jgi:short-chain Z-isoprenyl diphosphate synthase
LVGSADLVLRPLYRAYDERLARQIEPAPVPRHIGIILDSNRRHGERNGVRDPKAIYAIGAQKLDDVLDWCADLGVPAVTLWVFSTNNLDRPIEQISRILAGGGISPENLKLIQFSTTPPGVPLKLVTTR